MINVLMVGSHPSVKGGISTVIGQIDQYLKKSDDVNYHFISTYMDTNQWLKGVHFFKSLFEIKKKISKEKIDLVHVHMSYRGSFVRKRIICKYLWSKKIPTVLHIHGSEFKVWYGSLDSKKKQAVKEFLLQQGKVIVLGEEWARYFRGIDLGIKVTVINNAVKIPTKVVTWKNQDNYLFYSGVLLKRKGIYDLIDAMAILKNRGYLECNNLKLKIAGTGHEEKQLQQKIRLLELEQYVEFLGWIGEKQRLEKLILNASLGILPSYNEGLPMSLLECMSYGLPMITTGVGSIESVITNGKNGIIVLPGDANGLAEAIEDMLGNKERWESCSQNARKTIIEEFDEEYLFNKLSLVYKEIIDAKS